MPDDAADYYDLIAGEDDPRLNAKAAAAALRSKRGMGELALFSGSPALKDLGQAQVQAAQQGEQGLREAIGERLKNTLAIASQKRQEAELKNQIANTNFQHGMEGARFGNELEQQNNAQVKELADKLAPHAEFQKNYDDIQGFFDKYGNSPPGLGPIKGRLPDILQTKEGLELQTRLGQMRLAFDKATGGAKSMNPGMLEKYNEATKLEQTGTVKGMREGMRIMKELIDADAQAKAAAFTPRARATYFGRSPGVAEPGAQPAPKKQAPSQPGQHTHWLMSPDRKTRIPADAQGRPVGPPEPNPGK